MAKKKKAAKPKRKVTKPQGKQTKPKKAPAKRKVARKRKLDLYTVVKQQYAQREIVPIGEPKVYPIAKTTHQAYTANFNPEIAGPFLASTDGIMAGVVFEYIDKNTGEVKYISTQYVDPEEYEVLDDLAEGLLGEYGGTDQIGSITNASFNVISM
jgi:hypothetical protein